MLWLRAKACRRLGEARWLRTSANYANESHLVRDCRRLTDSTPNPSSQPTPFRRGSSGMLPGK
jgi:hypothetical protein